MRKIFCSLLTALFVVSCAPGNPTEDAAFHGDTIPMRHATLLQMVDCNGYTVADIKNPWNGSLLHRYILLDKDSALPPSLPRGTLIRTPLRNMLVFATLHVELIDELGCIDAVRGVCDSRYMTLPRVRRGILDGSVVDCGSSMNVNIERVVQLSPDAVWVLPFENGGYGRLDKSDYPVVECAEYMETSPLAGAEWMRFYGRLLGKGREADSLFAVVADSYIALRDTVSRRAAYRPTLLCELKNASAWYMPGGNSTMGRMYADAGADYLFAANGVSGSVPYAWETVLNRAADADIWLIKYGAQEDKTYSTLAAEFEGYSLLKPFRMQNIYACNVSRKRFYEETPFRPDLLLRELATIFHPELFVDVKLRYYEKMQN